MSVTSPALRPAAWPWLWRRAGVIARLRLQARAKRATVTLAIAREARFGRGVRISVERGSTGCIEMGPGSRLNDGVTVLLRGGTVRIGDGARVRRGAVLNVAGELLLEPRSILSYYTVVHCAERVRLGERSIATEFVTIVDSTHSHEGESDYFYENRETAPIDIGRHVWIGTKSTVLMGVAIGDDATVAAHSLVRSDVAAGSTVGGTPARPLRPVG